MDCRFALVLAFFAACCFKVQATLDEKLLSGHVEECKKKFDLTQKDFEAMKKHDFSEEKNKCFINCLGEKIGYIHDNQFNEQGAMSAIEVMMGDSDIQDKQKAQKTVSDCAEQLKDLSFKSCGIGPIAAGCLAKGAVDSGLLSADKIKQLHDQH